MEDAQRRVLIVHSSDELYGADRVVLSLVQSLAGKPFVLTVVVPTDLEHGGPLSQALDGIGVRAVQMNLAVIRRRYLRLRGLFVYGARLVGSTLALRRVIRRERIDLVHSSTLAVVPGALAARLTRTPHVWGVQEIITRPRYVKRILSWMVGRLSTSIVAVSDAVRSHLAAAEPRTAERTVVVHNGVESGRFDVRPEFAETIREELAIEPGRLVVGTIGRLRSGKGQEDLIRATALASADLHVIITGDEFPGEEPFRTGLQRLAQDLGIGEVVRFTGFRDDVPSLLAAMDVFVAPSIHPEAFGLTLIEAMAAGTAVVATRLGATPEIVSDGQTGLLVDPGDVAGLAAAIDRLANDDELRARLAAAGRDRAVNHFGLDRFGRSYARVYEAALQGRTADD